MKIRRVGGPIVIPKVYNGRGKAFFFFNYEELRLPNEYSRTRTILNPLTETGVFRYNVTVGGQQVVREVNVLALAAASGQLATTDPTVVSVLSAIRAATQTTGTVKQSPDPNTMSYDFLSGGNQYEKQPTTRIDYNLTNKHRITGTYIWQVISRDPDHLNSTDVRFPGLSNYRKYLSYRDARAWGAARRAGTIPPTRPDSRPSVNDSPKAVRGTDCRTFSSTPKAWSDRPATWSRTTAMSRPRTPEATPSTAAPPISCPLIRLGDAPSTCRTANSLRPRIDAPKTNSPQLVVATIRTMAAPADRRRELMLGQIRDGHSGRCRVDPRLSYNRPVMNLLYYGDNLGSPYVICEGS